MSKYVLSGGFGYIDYDRPSGRQRQWLLSEFHAGVLSNFLAVLVPFVIARGLFPVLKRIILLSCSPAQNQPLEGEGQTSRGRWSLASLTRGADAPETLSWDAFMSAFHQITPGANVLEPRNRQSSWSLRSLQDFWHDSWVLSKQVWMESPDLPWITALAGGMALLFFGTIVAGVLCALVASDTTAISNHPGCNIYSPGSNTSNPSETRTQKFYHDIEVDSGVYARRCYDAIDGADGCNSFYQQSIPYTAIENVSCPFKGHSVDLCFDGPSSAFSLSTGKVPPEAIGINTPLKYTFERETTCSPLLMDNRLIRRMVDENNTIFYRYLYGRRKGNQGRCTGDLEFCTFELRIGFVDGPSYSLHSQEFNPFNTNATTEWEPLWRTNPSAGNVTSIILVQNLGIQYPSQRGDPIFPAETTFDNGTWYYNTRWHAGVLACFDRTTICSPNGTICGDLSHWSGIDLAGTNDFHVVSMMFFSLLTSTIGGTVMYRREQALLAQAKAFSGVSLELAPEHWKLEVRQLFETSLARIQVNARNIARGPPDENTDGLESLMRPEYEGMCYLYKFKSTGWRNVSTSGFSGVVGAGLILMILSLHGESGELWVEKPLRWLCGTAFFGHFKYLYSKVFWPLLEWTGNWLASRTESTWNGTVWTRRDLARPIYRTVRHPQIGRR